MHSPYSKWSNEIEDMSPRLYAVVCERMIVEWKCFSASVKWTFQKHSDALPFCVCVCVCVCMCVYRMPFSESFSILSCLCFYSKAAHPGDSKWKALTQDCRSIALTEHWPWYSPVKDHCHNTHTDSPSETHTNTQACIGAHAHTHTQTHTHSYAYKCTITQTHTQKQTLWLSKTNILKHRRQSFSFLLLTLLSCFVFVVSFLLSPSDQDGGAWTTRGSASTQNLQISSFFSTCTLCNDNKV